MALRTVVSWVLEQLTPQQRDALRKIDKLSLGGHEGARELATYWVGQGVGLMNQETSVRNVMQEFQEDFLAACERLQHVTGVEA